MIEPLVQRLRVMPGQFAVERVPGQSPPDDAWVALVRAPEGLTVIRKLRSGNKNAGERWMAIYGGATAHHLDLPGMLAALVAPLAAASVPVFVASTFHADLVFVPLEHEDAAVGALRAAGHEVTVG